MLRRLHQGDERERKKLAQVARYAALGQLVDPDELAEDKESVDESAAAFGLMPIYQVEQTQPIYLWPDNVAAWNFYQAVFTQWVVGPGGAVGLNYRNVEVVRDARRIRRKDWPKLFAEVQAMERATLSAWREKNK